MALSRDSKTGTPLFWRWLEADPKGPAPLIDPPRRFATCADVLRLETSAPWAWQGFLPSSGVAGVASGEGVGKTRLALDLIASRLARRRLARRPAYDFAGRIANALGCRRWPAHRAGSILVLDGHAARGDHLSYPPDDPFGGVSLDEPETMEALNDAVRIHKPAFVVIDS